MYKYRVTNTSRERGANHARPIFLTEAGRLLQPGDAAPINRLDKGTEELVTVGDLKVETGSFAKIEPKKKKPVVDDDDDDDFDRPKPKVAAEKAPAGFHDVKRGQNKKVVPLKAAGAEPDAEEPDEGMSASTDDDDDLGIPAVTKADVASKTGLKDLEDPAPKPSAAASAFSDNFHVGKSKN